MATTTTLDELVDLLTPPPRPSAQIPRQISSGTVAFGIIPDLADASTCIDLVGTGKTEAADLIQVGLNDQVSMFFWRKVDLNMGAIEVFEDSDFKGRRSTIFFSEWPANVKTLQDRQTAILYDAADGTGISYDNIKGWGTTKEIARLSDVHLNDVVSSFKWQSVNPVKEVIKPFNVTASNSSDEGGLTSHVDGTNDTSQPQAVTVTLRNSTTQIVTVETSDKRVTGIITSLTQTASVRVEGIASASTQCQTKTVELSVAQTVNAPARTSYVATLLVIIGTIPTTEYSTTAERWYKDPVTGSKADPQNNGWYKRVEDVRLTLTGSLACRTKVNIKATPF
ncbi:uncharacterized protein Bfra_001548 [Botrytis fragariae]|uniref:Uncharacterized protein n=1 Tax=Botrytis fragariae TaxID=1964551 RepID=A0A8H6EMD2_9HELO|nr:uncharacterized protein Bfra_001548 [Botrytis fragariae]KAF5877185.1 hypothetical protein Bfra_001548 [Botrytis fragariae]